MASFQSKKSKRKKKWVNVQVLGTTGVNFFMLHVEQSRMQLDDGGDSIQTESKSRTTSRYNFRTARLDVNLSLKRTTYYVWFPYFSIFSPFFPLPPLNHIVSEENGPFCFNSPTSPSDKEKKPELLYGCLVPSSLNVFGFITLKKKRWFAASKWIITYTTKIFTKRKGGCRNLSGLLNLDHQHRLLVSFFLCILTGPSLFSFFFSLSESRF